MSKAPVVVVGSINIDLVANTDRIPVEGETILGRDFQIHPGGKGANQAVAVARLGHPVSMIGKLGDDAFGSQLKAQLESAGVDAAGVMTAPGTSGVAVIIVGQKGENCIVITPGANALLTPQDLDTHIHIIRSAGVVLTQLEIPIETVQHLAKICRREKVPLILDPAPAKEIPESLLEEVEWFTPNETEASFFAGGSNGAIDTSDLELMAKTLMKRGVKGLVLKLGARGAFLATREGLAEMLPSFPVRTVDTTAAGDAFNGAFATALMTQMDPLESARFAAAAAAISVTRHGAQPSMPTMADVKHLREGSSA
ncbi:ribokinase [Silvibacterium bohemicum]|uniref:Ribokinase n=1 Tax=Silvibacterium bohemicum TaxID=1577686 RepID=A0A841JNG8_9BACT|nr:ribokinase [Silvibacterium bohemicum]MBB6142912.1 ribokinase [Silvibacterium bohemicum]